jgi:hypothetical protein
MKRIIVLSALMAIALPVAAQAQPLAALRSKAAAELPKVREAFDDQLLDYPSARFKKVRAGYTEIGSAPYFCGQLNAKNSSGAYIGWRYFSWTSWDAKEPLVMEGADGEGLVEIAKRCGESDTDDRDTADYSTLLTSK